MSTTNFSNQDLAGQFRLFCLEFDRSNLHHTSWLDGNVNDYQVPDPIAIRSSKGFQSWAIEGEINPLAGSVAEVIGMPSVMSKDRLNVQNYLARKWGLPIGQNRE